MSVKHVVGTVLAIALMLWGIGIAGAQDSGSGTTIILSDGTATVNGAGVTVAGHIVTITAAGTYNLTGIWPDGQIIVDTSDAELVSLSLNGVELSSAVSVPLYIQNAAAAELILIDGTHNSVTSSTPYDSAEDALNAAIFSAVDLTISGSGSLSVVSAASDGIVSSGSLMVTGAPVIAVSAGDDAMQVATVFTLVNGELNLVAGGGSSNTPDEELSAKGIKAEENIIIEGGVITIDAADDAIRSETDLVMNAGSVTVTAIGKAIHASYNLEINGGAIKVFTCDEGIEGGFITINDGDIDILATDDGINVSEPDDVPAPTLYYLHINGGYIVVDAEGDGIDSNGSIVMAGGVVIVNGPTSFDDGALDYDGTFDITGGQLIAVGSAGMPAMPGEASTQPSVLVIFDSALEAGTLLHLQTSDGAEMFTFAPGKTFQSLVYSAPELAQGVSYDVYYGGSSDGAETNGLYAGGSYTPGTLQTSFTVEGVVIRVGNAQGFGSMMPGGEMPEGGPGGMPPGGELPEGGMPPGGMPPGGEMPEGGMPPGGEPPTGTNG